MGDFDFKEDDVNVENSKGSKPIPISSHRTRPQKKSAVIVEGDLKEPFDDTKQDGGAKKEDTEKPKYDPEELIEIFDEIIFNGEYVEDVTIKKRLKVSFKTRTAAELTAISKVVDSGGAALISTVNEQKMLLNLQYGLASYQGNILSTLKAEERAKFIGTLAGPIIAVLVTALYEFDTKVQAACQEGEQNL